jgi:hypothetical protein
MVGGRRKSSGEADGRTLGAQTPPHLLAGVVLAEPEEAPARHGEPAAAEVDTMHVRDPVRILVGGKRQLQRRAADLDDADRLMAFVERPDEHVVEIDPGPDSLLLAAAGGPHLAGRETMAADATADRVVEAIHRSPPVEPFGVAHARGGEQIDLDL